MEGCLGEESFQMWELNRRLEAYLARVKALEEHYELLSAELVGLRAQSGDASWRARADDELAALRALVDQRWREKHAAEVARDSLEEEVESVAGRCQQQRLARERAAEEMARSRRAVEAEKRAQAWLSGRAAELERELEALRAAHDEERAGLTAPVAAVPCRPGPPRGAPAPGPEVEELALRLGEAWRGAVRGYQERVARMETALGQARQRLGRAVQGAREGRLELQQLQAERGGLQERRAALEQRLEGCWQERLRATETFQLAVEALEQEKRGLQTQIAQVLEGRQQLAHLKMSLSLEVATYRTLLEAENSRLRTPGGGPKASFGLQDPKLELHFPGTPEGRRLGPLLSVLSPTPLSSPLPETLETPVPTFLKSQEFLQARTPTLASTPILSTTQAPCPATDGVVGAQEAPPTVLQPQGERQQLPQAAWGEAGAAAPAGVLLAPEEPGGKQREAGRGPCPEDRAFSPLPLTPEHPSLEAKDGERGESRASGGLQGEGGGHSWELAEEGTAAEAGVASSPRPDTRRGEEDVNKEETPDAQAPSEGGTPKPLEVDGRESLPSLGKQGGEARGEERRESPRPLGESWETLQGPAKENRELEKSLGDNDVERASTLEEEIPELLKPRGREAPQTLQPLERENQGLTRSLEDDLETFSDPGEENQESARSPAEESFEAPGALDGERRGPPGPLGEEGQTTPRPWAKGKPEPLASPGKDQEAVRPLDKEDGELVRALEGERVEVARCLETENLEPVRPAGDPRAAESTGAQEMSWPPGETHRETTKPLEKEVQELQGSGGENRESLGPLEENQGSRSSSEERDAGSTRPPAAAHEETQGCLGEEESLEDGGDQEPPRPPEEGAREPPPSADPGRWEDTVRRGRELGQAMPPGKAGVDGGLEVEPGLREGDGFPGKEPSVGEGALWLAATAGAWGAGEGHPKPEEQRGPAEGALGEEGTEGPQDPEGQAGHMVASGLRSPRGVSDGTEPVSEGEGGEDEVGSGLETGGQGLEQEAVRLEDPGCPGGEEVTAPGQRGEEAQGALGSEGPGEDPEETATLEPGRSREPLGPPGAGAGAKPGAPWAAEAMFPAETLCQDGSDTPQPGPRGSEEAEEGAEPAPGAPSPAPEVDPEPKALAEEEWGSEWFPKGPQDEGEESGEESEADELGDTLPDSTALGLYPRPPASPGGDLAAAQRQAGEEGRGPAALAPGDRAAHPEAGVCGQDAEDLGTEASLLPGVPRELTDPPGQVSQLGLEPAAWGQDGESDGFADEESGEDEGEEGEEERALGAGPWGPGPSASSLLALSGPQRESPPSPGPVSIPWDTTPLRGTAASPPATALETGSQDSTEPSGSEDESDTAPLEREDQVPGPLGTPGGTEDAPGVNGQGPSLREELEHVNGGLVNWVEQSDGAGQEKVGAFEGGRGSPLEEGEVGGALKPPWAGATLHLGPSQFLQFTQREGDGDSWSSGED
ncbi:nestin [Rousettus aegyptiacus]|uniref:nestin n=1 Tax=Rousettus aegyptiacus TaxID=9407 RepID=UPI00168CD871|nr:nestin [Rousettus aegyptiacus]